MLISKIYNRERAVAYAGRWAFDRNPLYFDYTGIGGNCTNFVSQCLFAGGCMMNFTPVFGWYYLSAEERTASWTGVEFFYNFITTNKGLGPYGRESDEDSIIPGDVIQLGRKDSGYYHTLLVTGRDGGSLLVAAQSDDAFDRPLSTYRYDYARFIHIEGVRIDAADFVDCYASLISGDGIMVNGMPPAKDEPPAENQENVEEEEREGGGGGGEIVGEGDSAEGGEETLPDV